MKTKHYHFPTDAKRKCVCMCPSCWCITFWCAGKNFTWNSIDRNFCFQTKTVNKFIFGVIQMKLYFYYSMNNFQVSVLVGSWLTKEWNLLFKRLNNKNQIKIRIHRKIFGWLCAYHIRYVVFYLLIVVIIISSFHFNDTVIFSMVYINLLTHQ